MEESRQGISEEIVISCFPLLSCCEMKILTTRHHTFHVDPSGGRMDLMCGVNSLPFHRWFNLPHVVNTFRVLLLFPP